MLTHDSGSQEYDNVNQVEQVSEKKTNCKKSCNDYIDVDDWWCSIVHDCGRLIDWWLILMMDDVPLFTIVVDHTLRKLLESKGRPVSWNTLPVCHCQTWLRFKLGFRKIWRRKFKWLCYPLQFKWIQQCGKWFAIPLSKILWLIQRALPMMVLSWMAEHTFAFSF